MSARQPALGPLLARLLSRASLNRAEQEAILDLPHRLERIPAGRYLVRAGDTPSRCYALLEGFAYRHKVVGNGARQIVGIHVVGDLVDLHNSMLDQADENVQALTEISVAVIVAARVTELIDRFPGVAKALLKESLIDGAIFSEWIANVGRRDSRSRMAHILCELAIRQKAVGLADGAHFNLPMTQDQLADALGLTPVHVNRTLKQLESEGLISRSKRAVSIEDWEALTRVGDFSATYLHLPEPTQEVRSGIRAHLI